MMDAAIAALLGASIGVLGTLGTAWIQQRQQTRRERLKLATELALVERTERVEHAVQDGGGWIPPISVFVAHHMQTLDALASGTYGPEEIARIEQRQAELMKAQPVRVRK